MSEYDDQLEGGSKIKPRFGAFASRNQALGSQSDRVRIKAMAEIHELTIEELDNVKILHAGMKNKQVLNAFRELRVKLLQKSKGDNFICLVSSLCERGGGGSYVATNLAAAFALDKTKTSVLVDCDLYAPSLDYMLGIDANYGITDYLDDYELDVQDIIYASGVPRMRVVPIGSNRERGAEHFSSERMSEFITAMKSRYSDRFIIIDAPPILNSAETRILADLCDMAVLVLPYGKANMEQVQAGIDVVDKNKLAGIVFNN
jgi:Mrp family chromosome partitioning ATPase